MTSPMQSDANQMRVTVWDLGPTEPIAEKDSVDWRKWKKERDDFDGPLTITMTSVNVREAMERDKERYVRQLPKGVKPGPGWHAQQERQRAEMAEFQQVAARDPQYGTGASPP